MDSDHANLDLNNADSLEGIVSPSRKCESAAHDSFNAWESNDESAAELLLKLGFRVSSRLVRRYMPDDTGSRRGPSSQRWMTFVRNHAQGILACDFFATVTASFRVLYVFVVMEVGTRRIAHFNVTTHPAADWTLQQFREIITGEKPYRFLIHDRDSIYPCELDSP
jgi:hypothetical protein